MATDWKAHWQELAKKHGVPEERAKVLFEALGDEAVQKAFTDGFVTVSDHHRTADAIRADQRKAEEAVKQMQEWYNSTALPAYQQNVKGIEELNKWHELYGSIDDPGNGGVKQNPQYMTREEWAKEFDQRMKPIFSNTSGVMKTLTSIGLDYYHRFKEPPPVDELEKFAVEKGLPLDQAYKEFISPKVEAQRNAEIEERIKQAREEGMREGRSQAHLPIDGKPKEFSPFFETKPAPENLSPHQREQVLLTNFIEEWNNAAESEAAKS